MRLLAFLPLWVLLLLMASGYGLLALWFPLSPAYRQILLVDIRAFAPTLLQGAAYGLLLLLLHGAYWLAYRQARQRPLPLPHLLLLTLLFSLPLLIAFPINSTDLYWYVIRGRISSVHRQNPYVSVPGQFADDPFLMPAGEWANDITPYGPLWEMAAAAITAVAPHNLYLSLLLFKLLALCLHLIAAFLIWQLTNLHLPTLRAPITLLWSWNPALLLTFVVNAHNDALMLVWLLAGYWLIQRQRPAAGFLVAVLAALSKPIALLALPFFWLTGWRQLATGTGWHHFRYTAVTLAGSLLLALLAFAPFGSPLELGQRLLREASDYGGYSLTMLIILVGRTLNADPGTNNVLLVALALFLLVAMWQMWQMWRGKYGRWPLRPIAHIFLAYIVTAFSFRIWYAVWPFPWLLLDAHPRRRLFGVLFLLCTQLSVLIYGHLRVHVLYGSHTLAHLIGIPFILLLPLLLTCATPHSCYYSPHETSCQSA